MALWAIDVDGTNGRGLAAPRQGEHGPVSPSGIYARRRLLFSRAERGHGRLPGAARSARRDCLWRQRAVWPTLSSGRTSTARGHQSGRVVAYVSRRGEVAFDRRSMMLVVHDLESGFERRFTPEVDGIHDPTWSPDGRALLFGGRVGSTDRLYSLSLDDGAIHPVEPTPTFRAPLDWSTDGARMFGVISRDGRWGVGVRDMATGREHEIAWPTKHDFSCLARRALGGHYTHRSCRPGHPGAARG